MLPHIPTAEELLATFNRPLPASDEYERGVLSCILQEPSRLSRNFNTMPPALFYHSIHREFFTVLVDELVRGRPIDNPVNITHHLRSIGRLDAMGGPAFISELFAFVPIPAHFPFYLKGLQDLLIQRNHIAAHARAIHRLYGITSGDGEGGTIEALDEIKGILEEAGKVQGQPLKSRSLGESMDEVLSQIEYRMANPGKLPGFTTGFPTIDRQTGGFQPGHVWVFGGEPGDGKSTIMQNGIEAAAAAGAKVRWYPLEMPTAEQAFRCLCSASSVDNEKLYIGKLSPAEQQSLTIAVAKLKRLGVQLVEVEDATATDILADIEKSDCDIAVVDYLQLLDDTSARKSDTRETILAGISRRTKRLAKRAGKCIVTASQLNDGGKLRESRAIGQDADKVAIMKKCEDANSETGFDDAQRRLWFDKNRGGKRHWELPLRFLGQIFQFRELNQHDA